VTGLPYPVGTRIKLYTIPVIDIQIKAVNDKYERNFDAAGRTAIVKKARERIMFDNNV